MLGRLVVHCPMRNMDERQFGVLFNDYLDDLSPYPAQMIAEACREYRLDPKNTFFPSSAQILALVNQRWYPVNKRLKTIERLLAEAEHARAAVQVKPDLDFSVIRAELDAVPDPKPEPVNHIVTDRTYFDAKQPNEQQPTTEEL